MLAMPDNNFISLFDVLVWSCSSICRKCYICLSCSLSAVPTAVTPATHQVPLRDTTKWNTQITNTTTLDRNWQILKKHLNSKVLSQYQYSHWHEQVLLVCDEYFCNCCVPVCVFVCFRGYEVSSVWVCLQHQVGVEPAPEEQTLSETSGRHVGGKQYLSQTGCHGERLVLNQVSSEVSGTQYNILLCLYDDDVCISRWAKQWKLKWRLRKI